MGLNPEHRKKLLDMAKRRAKPGSGSNLQVLREERSAYTSKDLVPDLGNVRFVVVGGLATRQYMPERMTLDTDILICAGDREEAERALKQIGCRKTGNLTIGGSTWHMPNGRSLDLIALDEPWVAEAIGNPVRGKDGLPYIALSYLVLMKLASGRMQDLADISRMLGPADEDTLDGVRHIVTRYRCSDTEDLESLISLGKLEYEQRQGGGK